MLLDGVIVIPLMACSTIRHCHQISGHFLCLEQVTVAAYFLTSRYHFHASSTHFQISPLHCILRAAPGLHQEEREAHLTPQNSIGTEA